MSDTNCAHCGAGMHRLTRWCQKCGKSAGNPVIPITYPTVPVSTTSKASVSFPAISFSQTEPASVTFTPAPAPEPGENANAFNFLPKSMQPATKPSEGTAASSLISQFTQAAAQASESARPFNFMPQSTQKPSVNTNGFQVPEYAAVDTAAAGNLAYDSSGAWQEGEVLVAIKDAVLPNRCVKCNGTAEPMRITRKLSWHHPAIYLLWLFSPLIYIIVALVVRKQATLDIPLCS